MDNIGKNRVCGSLSLQSNSCTEQVKIHPVTSGTWYLYPADMDRPQKKTRFTSVVIFDRRQIWKAYYFHFADSSGWVVERNGLYLRMPEKVFERFFGRFEISDFSYR